MSDADIPDTTERFPDISAAHVENVRVEEEMEQSYIDYAMSVIVGRALPDVRDGLKPVHRRILYAMHEEGVTSNSGHRKSSSIVGTTMGNYHPHGDSAIYDTLVRMAQDFSMRYPLVDGQGNFGSIDGDPPAAMRYTEARMSPIAEELLDDIEKDTVDWQSNYDDRLQEPLVLPSAFPNLLVNGSNGIAVGMSTNIPPHNLGEVIDATVHLIDNPDADIEDLMQHIKGPDFPTGGRIVGRNAIHKAYKTGRGKLCVRGKIEIEEDENRIIVTEIPFQVDKSKLIKKIADLVNQGDIEGISDIRDESDRDGIRVVIELKRKAIPDVVRNQLLDSTRLENTFGVINLALVDGQPKVLDLKETLENYIEHRKEVVTRRSRHELEQAEDRAHILEGRLMALENIEDIIEIIQDSEDRTKAKEIIRDEFEFSEGQADHIVRMQLGSLTALESEEIEDEYDSLQDEIERLTNILEDESVLFDVIKKELLDIKDEHADERRTVIEDREDEVTHEDLIPERDVLVVLTRDGYAKRMDVDQFENQNRGGKGIIGADIKEGDEISTVFVANTHDYLMCFTNHGNVYWLKVYEVPEMGRTSRGRSMVNLVDLDNGEEITATVPVDSFDESRNVAMVTREGYIKRTSTDAFSNPRSTGIIATSLEEEDELVDVHLTDGSQKIVLETRNGMSICFDESEVRCMGRNARGVIGIDLEDGDEVIGMAVVDGVKGGSDSKGNYLLTVTKDGHAKRTPVDEYRVQSRAGKGLIDIKTQEGTVSIHHVTGDEDIVVMSSEGQ
ncbi:MAG: DNA gyrase subunit A, partial [Halobacteria archaeon]|nr:DNA gyrase subunit A [Halobacteria archaeon]